MIPTEIEVTGWGRDSACELILRRYRVAKKRDAASAISDSLM